MTKKDEKNVSGRKKKSIKSIVEDAHLWDYIACETEPLKSKKTREKNLSPAENKKTPLSRVHITTLNVSSSHVKDIQEVKTGDIRDVNRAMAKRVKAGKYPIDMRLDLHGMTQIQAHEALIQAVENAFFQGKRCLLVITGKGRFSKGGGVLRKNLPIWLNQQNLRPYILMVNEASPSDGGSGAFYIVIKRRRD